MSNETPQLEAAVKRLQKMASDNLPIGARVNAEQEYAIAYDAMVAKGLRPRLRGKYRIS